MLLFLWSTRPALGKGTLDKPHLTLSPPSSLLQNKLWINTKLRAVWQAGNGKGLEEGAATAIPESRGQMSTRAA